MATKSKHLGAVFIITFLNMIGFGIIIPLLPYYAAEFGAGPEIAGLLIGSYAAAQFIGAPIWGRISDQSGRRPVLLATILIATFGYILFGLATTVFLLFLSRLITGFMNGNISVIQAYVADITGKEDRVRGFGILGAAFGLGLVTGPALGGILANWSYSAAVYGAAILNLFSMVAAYYFLPESQDPNKEKSTAGIAFNLGALRKALQQPLVRAILLTRFIFSLSFSTFATVFALYTEYGLHLNPQTTAYLLAYVGLLMVIVQGFGMDKLSRYISDGNLIYYSLVVMAISLLGWGFVRSVPFLLIVLFPLAVSGGIFNTVINSALSKIVKDDEIGGMLGISSSLESFTRIIAPAAGGYLLAGFGLYAPGLVSAFILFAFIPYAYKYFIKDSHSRVPKIY